MNGIERIKVLASEIKDEALLTIIDYLVSRTDMNEKYLNEEKSLKQMIEFIKGEARKKAQNGVAMIKDEVVFGWAIHYFDESNEDLGLNIKKTEPVKVENTQSTVKTEDKKEENAQKIENIVQNKPKKSSNNYVPEGQLSLWDI